MKIADILERPKVERFFTMSCAVVLLATSGCKLYTLAMDYKHFAMADPLIRSLSCANLMLFAAMAELMVSLTAVISKNSLLKTGLMAWLSTLFLVYRAGLWHIGYKAYCTCLGQALSWVTVLELWHVDFALKIFLAYMLILSYYYFLTGLARGNRLGGNKRYAHA